MYEEMTNWELLDYVSFGQREAIMANVSEQLGYPEEYVDLEDIKEYINTHDWSHLFRLYLEWEGIINYHDQLCDLVQVLYGMRCKL